MAPTESCPMTAAEESSATTAHPGLVLGLACTVTAIVSLDIAVANVALPSIQQDLRVDQGSLQWVVVAYGLLLGGFLLVGGRMTDMLGRRRILLALSLIHI